MIFRNNQVMSNKVFQSCPHIIPVRVRDKRAFLNLTSTTRSGQQREQEFLVTWFYVCFQGLKSKR